MFDLDVPNIPLKMPVRGNLYKKAIHPYPYPTRGVIRGKDFNDILKILRNHQNDLIQARKLISERFDYHKLNEMFPDWNIQELSDFCRHTLVLNKDGIGWDIVDNMLVILNHITIPGWKYPNFDFLDEFDSILNLVQKLYFPDRLRNYIREMFEETKKQEIDFNRELKINRHLWTIRELWLLLSYLTDELESVDLPESHLQLINLVSNKFEEVISSNTIQLKGKICLVLLFIDAMDGYNKNVTIRSKEFIDRIWLDIKDLPYTEKISFKYLLGAAYSMVGYHLFRQDTDFVSRKLFIDNFVTNYISEDYDLGKWFADLLDYDFDELIFDLLIRGYSKTIPLLHQHNIELPSSSTKDHIHARISQFNGILSDILIYYLSIPEEVTPNKLTEVSVKIESNLHHDKTKLNTIELLEQVLMSSIFYNSEFSEEKQQRLLQTTLYLLERYIHPVRSLAVNIDFDINNNYYPFEKWFDTIAEEVKERQSLVLSSTFEQLIIRKVTEILDYCDTISTRTEKYLELHEICLLFLIKWLAFFSSDQALYHEALLILTPLVNICIFQQIRWYYENNFAKKSFLMNINLYAYLQFFNHRLDRFDNVEFSRIELSPHKRLSERYQEITNRWSVRDLLDQQEIKEMIIDTRIQFKESGLLQKRPPGNLIEDALIHGYLHEINRLENFVSLNYNEHKSSKFEIFLLDTGIYQLGDWKSTYRLERINSLHEGRELIPVPLFNNIHRLHIATDFFSIQEKTMDTLDDKTKTIQENFRQNTK